MSDVISVRWRKSSYGGAGNNCVEVATWRKSSYSGGGKDCVEVADWRTSTRSKASGECVEVADSAAGMNVRDSTQPELGHLSFASVGWSTFVSSLKDPHTE